MDLNLLGEVLPEESIVRDLTAWSALDEFVAWVDQSRVRFRHDLFRDAAYEGLAVETRREIHARLASAIEQRPGADLDEGRVIDVRRRAQRRVPRGSNPASCAWLSSSSR